MRRLLCLGLLLVCAGCHPLHERCRPESAQAPPCPAEKKVAAPAPEKKVSAPAPEKVAAPAPEVPRAAIAQEVLLVPRTVYVPYVAQTPTAPVKLTSEMTVLPPVGAPSPPPVGAPSPPVGAPAPPTVCPPPTVPCEQEMVDVCKKLNQRLDHLEQCIRDRKAPSAVCPPAPLLCPHPLRRLLFNRCDTCVPGDPQCEPWSPSEALPPPGPSMPERMPKGND